MIELPRPPFEVVHPRVKVFGLGNAGSNVLDRLVLDGLPDAELIAINTDAQALAGSVAPQKLQIGQTITRGLGAGGDPDVGRTAAEEGIGDILGALADATIVFMLVGLGGGTGSGAAPVIAEVTREHNAMVVVIATLPFAFEGKRRAAQAAETLAALRRVGDVVICFENDKMAEAVAPDASIQEAFAVADATISQCVRAIAAMTMRRGMLHTGFDEIAAAVNGAETRTFFGYGEAGGDNRAHVALSAALKNPLLDRGRRLKEAESAVVHVAGGPDLRLDEIGILMEDLRHHLDDETRLFFGSTVDPKLAGRISVTLFASHPVEISAAVPMRVSRAVERTPAPLAIAPQPEEEEEEEALFDQEDEAQEEPAATAPQPEPEPAPAAAPTARPFFATLRGTGNVARPAGFTKPREGRAEQMQFEPVNRGRFEKSEPTIIDGEDLDVPTFMRRGPRE